MSKLWNLWLPAYWVAFGLYCGLTAEKPLIPVGTVVFLVWLVWMCTRFVRECRKLRN